jgi:hypothetical protein
MAVIASAVALATPMARPAFGGTTVYNGTTLSTISISGSTALKNFVNGSGFTTLVPGTSITLSSGTFAPNWASTGGPTQTFDLAPATLATADYTDAAGFAPAIRLEYHESGSVEGILEMANDQIGPLTYVASNIDRNPNTGNAVWINKTQFGGVTPPGNLQMGQTDAGGFYLGAFYGATATGAIRYGPSVGATFSTSGVNISSVAGSTFTDAGQNAVQMAVSDVVPIQAFLDTTATSTAHGSSPWQSVPSDSSYGLGNPKLPTGSLGTAGIAAQFQNPSVLNMPASAVNPRSTTSATFGTGVWNTAGLANLDSRALAVTATAFVANPGTGLDRLNRTDADWLQLTGRLANGAAFNMTTRDVNSGTRNVAALNTGIDPSWAVGVDDNGNGNGSGGADSQISIGGNLKFSNKTAGGAQLRPTVQNDRMAVGTLSIGDANGSYRNNQASPLRVLQYSDSTDGSSAYVQVSAQNITSTAYVIYQNEQLVTLKAPTPADANLSATAWGAVQTGTATGNVPAQGDNATNDVTKLRDNALNSVAIVGGSTSGINTLGQSAYALLTKGFILPQFMQEEKAQDGLNQSVSNPSYNSTLSGFYIANYGSNVDPDAPDSVTTGSVGTTYGNKGVNNGIAAPAFNGSIAITQSGNGGNYMFGNFDQTGVRDWNSVVVTGLAALKVLEASTYGTSAFSGANNNAVLPATAGAYTLPASLQSMYNSNNNGATGATKGDLIVMGDYDGRGVFDGKSLYEMAIGASLANANAAPDPTQISGGTSDHLTIGTGTTTIINASGSTTATAQTFGDAVRSGVLFKNAALDYLNNSTFGATAQMKTEARAVLEGSAVPSGATLVGTDTYSGQLQFTYDQNGTYAFDKHDVNRDGVVDFNDAVLVDQYQTQSYTNLANQLYATMGAPVTGAVTPLSLVAVQQIDNEASIGAADMTEINKGLAGNVNLNWYTAGVAKTGTGTITYAGTAGTVIVYPGAKFTVSAGTVNINGTMDPFTDNTTGGSTTTGNHVGLVVNSGATVALGQTVGNTSGGANTYTLDSLSLDTASGSKLDIANNTVNINESHTSKATIQGYLQTGYASGAWNGTGLISALAGANAGRAIGYADSNDGTVAGLPANTMQVKYTLYGDTNLDGSVSIADVSNYAPNFNKPGTTFDWAQGDFNNDGTVSIADVSLAAPNFNHNLNASGLAVVGGTSSLTTSTTSGLVGPVKGASMASSSMKTGAIALAAAAGIGGIHTAQSNAAASVTYILSKDDNGTGTLTTGEYAIYAVDTSSASNQGISIFGVSVTGMTSVNNLSPEIKGATNAGSTDGGEDVGLTASRSTTNIANPVSGQADPGLGAGESAYVIVYGLGQNAAHSPMTSNLTSPYGTANGGDSNGTIRPSSAGGGVYAGPSSSGGFQFGLLMATGSFTGAASTIAFNATTTNDVANVWTDLSGDQSTQLNVGNGGVALVTQDLQAVPEPAAAGLLTVGAMGFLARRRRRQATLVA